MVDETLHSCSTAQESVPWDSFQFQGQPQSEPPHHGPVTAPGNVSLSSRDVTTSDSTIDPTLHDMIDGNIVSDKISSEAEAVMDTVAPAPAPAQTVDVIMIDDDDPPSHFLDTSRIDLASGQDVSRRQEESSDAPPMVSPPSLQSDNQGHSPPDHEGANGSVKLTGNSGPDPLQLAPSTRATLAPKDVLSPARKTQSPGPHNAATGAMASKS